MHAGPWRVSSLRLNLKSRQPLIHRRRLYNRRATGIVNFSFAHLTTNMGRGKSERTRLTTCDKTGELRAT